MSYAGAIRSALGNHVHRAPAGGFMLRSGRGSSLGGVMQASAGLQKNRYPDKVVDRLPA